MARTFLLPATLAAVLGLAGGCMGGGSNPTELRSAPTTAPTATTAPTGSTGAVAPPATTAGAVDPNAPEDNPPGDIPDNQVFVAYSPPSGGFRVKVPEGWARTEDGGAVTFTDKLNRVRMETVAAASAPTLESVRQQEVPAVAASAPRYEAGKVGLVTRKAGTAVLMTYRADAPPDPVTGKVVHDDVERYEFWKGGKTVILTLSGPQGADNVDPWRIVTDSFTWLP
jgi:hypothetical protein